METLTQMIAECNNPKCLFPDASLRKFILGIGRRIWYVRCASCGLNGAHKDTMTEAICHWNELIEG